MSPFAAAVPVRTGSEGAGFAPLASAPAALNLLPTAALGLPAWAQARVSLPLQLRGLLHPRAYAH